MDLPPAQRDDVDRVLGVRAPDQQRRGPVPLHEHGGVPRPALHPDVVDLEVEIGQNAGESLEPESQRRLVMALTANRVVAEKAVMDVRCDRSHQLVPATVVDLIEALPDSLLDDRVVEHWVTTG